MAQIVRTSITLGTLWAIALIGGAPRQSHAACAAPQLQVSPDLGQTVAPSCAIQVAVPELDGPVDTASWTLAWSGGVIPVDVSAPARVTVQQGEAFIDPKTCQEYTETWDVAFWVYTLTPKQTLPRDVQIQILADQSMLGDFMVSDAATYCPALSPSVGMCGSGGPVPVEGCDWPPTGLDPPPTTGGEGPAAREAEEGGCSVATGRGSTTAALPLALLLALLVIRARRRERRRR